MTDRPSDDASWSVEPPVVPQHDPSACFPPAGVSTPSLDDIHCPTCGYHLRGLTEHRCPECGNPFDPNELANTFVPKWPRLLCWWLLADWLATLPAVIWLHELLDDLSSGGALAGRAWIYVSWMVLFCLILLGIIPVVGLWLMRAWGRRLLMLLLVLRASIHPGAFVYRVWYADLATDPLAEILTVEWLGMLVLNSLIPIVLIVFLWSGLRGSTLRPRGSVVPVVSLASHARRSDWISLSVVLLMCQGLWVLAGFLSELSNLDFYLGTYSGFAGVGRWGPPQPELAYGMMGSMIVYMLMTVVAVFRLWKHPARIRRTLIVLGILFLATVLLRFGTHLTCFFLASRQLMTTIQIASNILYHVGSLLPPMAVLLFVCLRVSREEIELIDADTARRRLPPIAAIHDDVRA